MDDPFAVPKNRAGLWKTQFRDVSEVRCLVER